MRKILMTTAAAVIAVPALAAGAFAQSATTGAGVETNAGVTDATGAGSNVTGDATTQTQTGAQTGVQAPTGAEAQTGAQTGAQAQTGAEAGAGATPRITVDNVVSSIGESASTAEQISAMPELKQVGVVTIDDRAGADAAAQVDEAVSNNEENVAQLREAIRANEELSSQLEAGGLDVETIVAARIMQDGNLILFTRG